MDMEALCAAVQEASWYLKQFTHSAYPGAFRAYTERFGPAYLAAVREMERERQQEWKAMPLLDHMEHYLSEGMDKKEAMKLVAKDRGLQKREIYQMLLEEEQNG